MMREGREVLTVWVLLVLLWVGEGLTSVTIDIERRVVDVIESQHSAEVCLVKSGTTLNTIIAVIATDEITDNVGSPQATIATSDEDFVAEPTVSTIALSGSETRKCVQITIIDDQTVERTEPFAVTITFPPDQSELKSGEIVPCEMQINVLINIIDDDAITVQFEQDMYMVDESDGMVDVKVAASGRTSFEYTFTVTPMDLTATNYIDYAFATPLNYSFGPTDENEPIPSILISIPIIDDKDELNETFKLTLEVSADGEAANVTEGPTSTTLVLIKDDDVTTIIQLYLRPVSDCPTWVETNSDAKLSEISAALSVPVQLLCNCSLSVQRRFFSCLGTTDSQIVVFLAELSYIAHPSVDMPSLLTSWLKSTPHIIVASAQLQVDSTCPVVIDSLEPESCAVAQPTDLPTVIIATVVACAIALLVVAITVAIVIAVVVCCKKQSKRRPNRTRTNKESENVYVENGSGGVAMVNMTGNPSYMTTKEVLTSCGSGGVAMVNMTENPSYMTAKEVLTSFTYNAEEDKADHTYEAIPY